MIVAGFIILMIGYTQSFCDETILKTYILKLSLAGKAVWKFAKEMAMSMAYTMAFTAIFEALGNIWNGLTPLFDKIVKTPEELQEKL